MHDLLIYLFSMVVMVPISHRLGMGSVIGYLLAGACIGPQGLALLSSSTQSTSQIAEFGVIMMLLLIGLELNPAMLWKMRGPIFGLGFLQVFGTIVVFASIAMVSGIHWTTGVVIGMALSVSSTAIVMQTLQERGYAKSVGGERAFAVLLFQDLAVIPLLALLPLLGAGPAPDASSHSSTTTSLASSLTPVQKGFLILTAVAVVIGVGRFLMRPLFQVFSRLKLREPFSALALLIVAAAAALMHGVGLSPALGAFLAGVVLADSEYRHQIEADIAPFKGLLLGLFFITVGAAIRFNLIKEHPFLTLTWVGAIIVCKALLVFGLGRFSKMRAPENLLFAVSLAQGGEFAFVLIADAAGILNKDISSALITSIALSMMAAPVLIALTIKYGMSRLECVNEEVVKLPDAVDESEKNNPVLVIGIGRFGQTLVRFLKANGFACTVLDYDSEQIEMMARFGMKSYFGDGSHPELLRAAGLDNAKVLVIAIDVPETTLRIVETLRPQYPKLPIFCRAYDRIHAYKLLKLGVNELTIETSGSAVILGTDILQALGKTREWAISKALLFEVNNRRSIHDLSKRFQQDDQETFITASKEAAEQLEAILKSDPEELLTGASSEWPRKD